MQEGEQHIPGALPGVAQRRAKLPVVPGQEILPPAVTASQAVLLREPHHLDEHLAQTKRVSKTRTGGLPGPGAAGSTRRPYLFLGGGEPLGHRTTARRRKAAGAAGDGGSSIREWLLRTCGRRRRWSRGGRLGKTAGENPFPTQEFSRAE